MNKIPITHCFELDDLLDLLGSHHLKVRNECILKTTIHTYYGHLKFWLCLWYYKCFLTCKDLMNLVPKPLLGWFIIVVTDDIVIYPKSTEDCKCHLRRALQDFEESINIMLNFPDVNLDSLKCPSIVMWYLRVTCIWIRRKLKQCRINHALRSVVGQQAKTWDFWGLFPDIAAPLGQLW